MRIFGKKKKPQEFSEKTFKTVICIPGPWNDWNEFILSIAQATDTEYLAAGYVLMNFNNKKHYIVDFCNPDETMITAFSYAGRVTGITDDCLNEIKNHKSVVYISGITGNLKDAEHIALAADAVLKAGGLGIKIETTGKAFEKNKWHTMVENFEESDLYEMFVVDSIVRKDGTVYSCGMQNLGLKDTIVSGEEFQQAVNLIKIFGYYQIIDKPTIYEGQTFSVDQQSPRYRILDEINQPYKDDEMFGNPFGMWRLVKE